MSNKLCKKIKTNKETNNTNLKIKDIKIIYDIKEPIYKIQPVNFIQKLTIVVGSCKIYLKQNLNEFSTNLTSTHETLCIEPNTQVVISEYDSDIKFVIIEVHE